MGLSCKYVCYGEIEKERNEKKLNSVSQEYKLQRIVVILRALAHVCRIRIAHFSDSTPASLFDKLVTKYSHYLHASRSVNVIEIHCSGLRGVEGPEISQRGTRDDVFYLFLTKTTLPSRIRQFITVELR